MMEWMDIASAPRDGTWILVTGGDTGEGEDYVEAEGCKRPVVAFYDPPQWMPDDDEHYPVWSYAAWDCAWRSGYSHPTHWMPLPPAPTAPAARTVLEGEHE